jgi:hypothetical protein
MGLRKVLVASAVTLGVLAIPATAFADSCANVSRAPAACGTTCSAPVIKGNWVYLPSLDPSNPPLWGFAPPGAPDSVNFGLPGANGNYQNTAVTGNQSLLDNSANCPPGSNTARQTSHGIQSGCE